LDKPGILLIILTNRTQVYKVGEARLWLCLTRQAMYV
jgi:hypothetical protein